MESDVSGHVTNVIIYVTPPGSNQLYLSHANIEQLGPIGSCWVNGFYTMSLMQGHPGLWVSRHMARNPLCAPEFRSGSSYK